MIGRYGGGFTEQERERHDAALICLNGHWISGSFHGMPQFNQKHCDTCGAETIHACRKCNQDIRGSYPGHFSVNPEVPKFCHACGASYPWTADKISAADELADLIDELNDSDRQSLKSTFPDLICNTPRTEVAAVKFGAILKKVEPHFREAFKQILYSGLADAAKNILKGYGIGF
jgi:hypothetical protein